MNKNEIIINNIKTSMEMENQFLTDKDVNILNDFANNKFLWKMLFLTLNLMLFLLLRN